MTAFICHMMTACALTWLSHLAIVKGQLTSLNIQEDLQPPVVAVRGLTPKSTPVLQVTSWSTGARQPASKSQTQDSTMLSFSFTLSDREPETIPTSTFIMTTTEVTKTQSGSYPAQIYPQLSVIGDVTSSFALVSSKYLIDVTGTTTFLSPEVPVSFSKTPELEPTLLHPLPPPIASTKKATLASTSRVSDMSTSTVGRSSSKQVEMSSSKPENSTTQSKDIITPAVKMDSTPFPKYVSDSPASKPRSTTRWSTQTWARKPTHVGGTGQSTDVEMLGAMTPGAKVAIGIVIALCILGVVVAGVVAYRRYSVTHRDVKSLVTSDAKYNKVSYKNDEGMLILPERR